MLVLKAKNALKRDDCHRLNVVEMDDPYDNVIHFTMESSLCVYLVKERNKILERVWGIRDGQKPPTRGVLAAEGSSYRDGKHNERDLVVCR